MKNQTQSSNTKAGQVDAGRRKKQIVIGAVIAAVILAAVGYSIYAAQQSQKSQANNDNKGTQNTSKDEDNTPAPSTDPYAGWETASLQYEKASFKYPSAWTISNVSTPNGTTGTVTPGSDQVKLVSPTGLTITIDSGVSGIGGGPYGNHVFSATPIATLGGNYFLGFGRYEDGTDSELVTKGTVGTTADKTASVPLSKNISVMGSDDRPFNMISMAYYDGATALEKPVSAFQSDASYNDALLIIKSLSY
ncbi:hypothetical protein PV726_37720 [Streptomyces europaeiscabiei]|uniref:hypothetical protein n=1 Tax=Streptomyces europaeiscabiei TaxID=146819 RepID=UPI0029B0612E|nr:hypothetical protein [Streptomyces europaeiscabiei]MDX3695958.1 hypothetical protein [Streptomyces europaeiscabiei]